MTNLAVILSARKERTSDVPFPLLPYDGNQCLIDRTISLLKDIGIGRILLVVGFRKELFEKYTDDTVQLIVAPNYEFSSSMASLAAVKEYVDEGIILTEKKGRTSYFLLSPDRSDEYFSTFSGLDDAVAELHRADLDR